VGDVVGVLDALSLARVFVVGQGWGALLAWHLATVRPDRVRALVNMSGAFMPRNPSVRPLQAFRRLFGDGYYLLRLQEPGAMEAEFARMDTRFIFRKLLTTRETGAISLSGGGRRTRTSRCRRGSRRSSSTSSLPSSTRQGSPAL
jgi:pimeloyl-ACP methyl ester carboxylesterase